MHYDLRLEVGHVLVSWALPKGPTLSPSQRRLAVPTEDHPLEYLDWEGNIPEGQYGAGTMMVYDIGLWEPVEAGEPASSLQKGELKFRLRGQKVFGEFTLVRTDGTNWLLIKKEDAWCRPDWQPEDYLWSAVSGRSFAEVREDGEAPQPRKRSWPRGSKKSALPLRLEPMLAEVSQPFEGEGWSFEVKWDGIRALVSCRGQALDLYSRNGHSYLGNFPEMRHLRARMDCESFLLDGELVVLDADGVPHFEQIAPRLKVDSGTAIERLSRSQPAVYYAFDLLYLDGRDICGLSYLQRRRLLQEVLRPDQTVRVSESLPGSGLELFALLEARGLEGMMAKRDTSVYRSGRSGDWLKVKSRHTMECLVVGFALPKDRGAGIGALALAVYDPNGALRYVGRVGSGFTREVAEVWRRRLESAPGETSALAGKPGPRAGIHWREPVYVVEVEYSRITRDGHLFHPVFLRERTDMSAADLVPEKEQPDSLLLSCEGGAVKVSNARKLLFPEAGLSKLELAEYYRAVASAMLPHLRDRPLSLRRYPDGISGPDFFQKHLGVGRSGPDLSDEEQIFVMNEAGLVYLANLATIEIHATLARRPALERPDGILLDLDPQPKCSFETVKRVALEVRRLLGELEWEGRIKLTGSRGVHILIPVAPAYTFEQTRLAAGVLATVLQSRLPRLVTLVRTPAKRPADAVYLDAPQNRDGATAAAPFSVRATAEASVSAPLSWEELDSDLGPRDFRVGEVTGWLSSRLGLWSSEPDASQRIEDLVAKLEALP